MQLPSNMLHKAFSEIDVNKKSGKLEIFYSTMVGLSGEMSEGWKTGIAIDASVSMSDAFGKGLTGSVPEEAKSEYKKKGWIQSRIHDGSTVYYWKEDAYKDSIKKGYLAPTKNIVEMEARKFSSYLAENLDEEGGTDIIYWACGQDGKSIEELGKLDSNTCLKKEFKGPQNVCFGLKTHLLPAVHFFEKKHRSAKRGLFIFITDGKLDDLDSLKQFTKELCKEIEGGKRNLFKAVLIGIGDEIDEIQMVELDDLDTGTNVDIWDHKIADDMKNIMEIFAELVDENTIIGPMGTVYDSDGKVAKKFNDGVPAKGHFNLPINSTFFTFEVGDQTIKQTIRRP